jgi:hypothetical protein
MMRAALAASIERGAGGCAVVADRAVACAKGAEAAAIASAMASFGAVLVAFRILANNPHAAVDATRPFPTERALWEEEEALEAEELTVPLPEPLELPSSSCEGKEALQQSLVVVEVVVGPPPPPHPPPPHRRRY